LIVENLQTGPAIEDLPSTVVPMRLGYGVDVLGRLPWSAKARSIYWGDVDTHGFAILNRARTYLPELESILMDEETLLSNKDYGAKKGNSILLSRFPSCLSPSLSPELTVYQALKQNRWGQYVRLEQERIDWDTAWNALQMLIFKSQ
jgi:hypothetical protein